MHISKLKQSKFLSRSDVNPPILVIIRSISEDNVAREGEPPEMKHILTFTNCAKPMVLNTTNVQIIASILKSDETDDWIGKQIVLYDDPNVSFGGRLVGGIRVRAPRVKAGAKPAPTPVAEPEPEIEPEVAGTEMDDVPF